MPRSAAGPVGSGGPSWCGGAPWLPQQAYRAQQFAAGKVPVNGKKAKPAKAAPQPDIASLETELSESLGTRVTIAHGRGGKGKLIIQYTDLDTLDGVLERLRPRG